MRVPAVVIAAALTLGGCAAPPEATEPPPEPEEVLVEAPPAADPAPDPLPAPPVTVAPVAKENEVSELVGEFQRLRKLNPSELGREQEAARLTLAQSRTDRARVRLAMMLAVPGSASADEARALELLDPVAKNPASDLQPLATLLVSYIYEQRRLLAQINTLQQNAQGLQQNVQTLQQNVQGLQNNVQALQQKLDALKTLERTLTERRQNIAPARR